MHAKRPGALVVAEKPTIGVSVLSIAGVLDSSTYGALRAQIIKAILAEPAAVVIDITGLIVPAESALAVFTSARWYVDQWCDVPVVLVCAHRALRVALDNSGITRYVTAFRSVDEALCALTRVPSRRQRRRARAELPAITASVARARELVSAWLTRWSQEEFIPVAKMIVTVLVENVLLHTDGAPGVRVETNGTTVTVAVDDASSVQALRRERAAGIEQASGLAIVAALSRCWGNAPTPSGKTVWAVIGPENRL